MLQTQQFYESNSYSVAVQFIAELWLVHVVYSSIKLTILFWIFEFEFQV